MDFLDSVFDHGFVVSKYDTVMMNMFFPNQDPHKVHFDFTTDWNRQLYDYVEGLQERDLSKVKPITLQRTLVSKQDPNGMKVIVVGYAPTAENLAKHMFDLLRQPIRAHYGRDIRLVNIRLYETPNGWVDYPGMQFNAAY
jgi:6-pyruvoyltetrahydropterin/6-carboxytetrahydropterin synthase